MMKRKHDDPTSRSSNKDGNISSVYLSDTKLVPRLRKLLRDNKNTKVLDITDLADQLQRVYNDYGRKKKNAFIKSVEKAYNVICDEEPRKSDNQTKLEEMYLTKKIKQKNKSSDDSDSVESFSSDPDDYIVYEERNSMNNTMSSLYSGNKKTGNSQSSRSSNSRSSTPMKKNMSDNTGYFIDRGPNKKNGSREDKSNSDLSNTKSDISKSDTGNAADTTRSSGTESRPFVDPFSDSGSYINLTLSEVADEIPSGATTPISVKSSDVANERTKKSVRKRKKKVEEPDDKSKGLEVGKSTTTFTDVGGNEEVLMDICKLLIHMRHPEVYQALGVIPPRGFLLHGPPGCGKTLLANAIAGELDLPFIKLASTEIVSGVSGESEEKLRDLFDKAIACAPCILFLDEIDAITPKRETASKDMERRIVSQLLTCMDDLSSKSTGHVLVIGATNRPDSIDPALRRAGRFDREICLGIPDESARLRILQVLCRNLKLSDGFDYEFLAKNTPGFVGADLTALTREAAMNAVNRAFDRIQNPKRCDVVMDCDTSSAVSGSEHVPANCDKKNLPVIPEEPVTSPSLSSVLCWMKEQPPLSEEQLTDLSISMEDFKDALKSVQPSAKREGFATIPDVTWEDIGALHDVREELQLSILAPVRHAEEFKALGLKQAPGILLAGPPGCGKTLLAKAIANESGINFISVKGPELLNMYVGESERAVRQVFQRARNSAPCVIFFDELDALCPKRSNSGEGGASVRVVNQMLTEMDGLEERKQVFIMGATNRPDIIDAAILRPGRLDKLLYVGLPTPADRLDILKTITKNGSKPRLSADVDLSEISTIVHCDGYTGADLAALVREASVTALRDIIKKPSTSAPVEVTRQHFEVAFSKVKPSVSQKDQALYRNIRERSSVGAEG